MNSIRKLIGICTGATALCVVAAFALVPATVLAEGAHRPQPKAASTQSVAVKAVAPSAACAAARQAIATARTDDRAEDVSEKLAATQAGAVAASDANEDQSEKAAAKALWTAAASACADQPKPVGTTGTPATPPTAGCVAAKQALKDALTKEKAHELSEKGSVQEHSAADKQEDLAEFAAIKSLWNTAATACGFSFTHK